MESDYGKDEMLNNFHTNCDHDYDEWMFYGKEII